MAGTARLQKNPEIAVCSFEEQNRKKEVISAIRKARQPVGGNFEEVFKTITADNGSEFLDRVGIKKVAKCGKVYYAHPYSS